MVLFHVLHSSKPGAVIAPYLQKTLRDYKYEAEAYSFLSFLTQCCLALPCFSECGQSKMTAELPMGQWVKQANKWITKCDQLSAPS